MNSLSNARVLWAFLTIAATAWGLVSPLGAASPGNTVVVVYNSDLPASQTLANYYALRREVPTNQIIGLSLPTAESIEREAFNTRLRAPLLAALRTNNLITFPATPEGTPLPRATQASIRYLVLCYGVPTRILKDPALKEEGAAQMREQLQRNEASVDSELACLPLGSHPLTGPLANPVYATTNNVQMHPTNGILMVARLDGPSEQIAGSLIDKAMYAETNGLWGRAYFDARGLTDANYKVGDDWIKSAAATARATGWETVLDEAPETFPAALPMPQIGLYAGWYDGAVSGPFTRPPVEFLPGAIAYHLHSFSAQTLRSTNANWVGPLLAAGATATMGCVDEPYLTGTPDLGVFMSRLTRGFSFGEAAYAAQGSLSWQIIVVGDPLYTPYSRRPDVLHADLLQRNSRLIAWSHLRVVNLNLVAGASPAEAMQYLIDTPETRQSAVLTQKIADLQLVEKKALAAMDMYQVARKRNPSHQQRIFLLYAEVRLAAYNGRTRRAYDVYMEFLKDIPEYPDKLRIYQAILPLAEELKETEMVERARREIKASEPVSR